MGEVDTIFDLELQFLKIQDISILMMLLSQFWKTCTVDQDDKDDLSS